MTRGGPPERVSAAGRWAAQESGLLGVVDRLTRRAARLGSALARAARAVERASGRSIVVHALVYAAPMVLVLTSLSTALFLRDRAGEVEQVRVVAVEVVREGGTRRCTTGWTTYEVTRPRAGFPNRFTGRGCVPHDGRGLVAVIRADARPRTDVTTDPLHRSSTYLALVTWGNLGLLALGFGCAGWRRLRGI
ncbi:MAG: hypothetical protein U0Q15_17915 [Kineosporiaceae bacterium]